MGTFTNTMDSLRDGNTSDGKFWIAIIIIVVAGALLITCVIIAFLMRRRRKRKRFQNELNDIAPSQLWDQGGTAQLAGRRQQQQVRFVGLLSAMSD
jgi:NADH:ubiquinone oxidoreductase subunit 3 (subunit A)